MSLGGSGLYFGIFYVIIKMSLKGSRLGFQEESPGNTGHGSR